jgi:predicted Zn finger-like uncharacterized protein
MSEHFVTQCPSCRTSFRVTPQQLGAARGAVRCGSCRELFNAAEQLRAQGHVIEAAPDSPPVNDTAAPSSSLKAEQNPAPSAPSATQRATESATTADAEHWPDTRFDELDLDQELAKLEAQQQSLQRQASTTQAQNAPDSGLHPKEQTAQATPPSAEPAASVADQLEQSHGLTADREQEADPPLARQRPAKPLSATASRPARQQQTSAHLRAHQADKSLTSDPLFELDEDPLHLDWRPAKKTWTRRLLWPLLILLAAIGLFAQYLAYNFTDLARQDRYRPWLAQLCPRLGCTLPSKVDIDQIKSSNLVVRNHPDFNGALVVDAILYNRADFSQPFPLLEMRFADINGQLLASRSFKPSEYLAGELAGSTEMPPQTPIHIALDILDPGSRAVNYSLNFHSPE